MKKTNYEMCMASLQRPSTYDRLSPERQWELDKSLGIVDWGGINIEAAKVVIAAEDIRGATLQFKMNLDELRLVVRAFDAKFPPKGGASKDPPRT
jgi:hypothetical protein